jgi:hypothetical protein
MPHFFEFSSTHPPRNPSPSISRQPLPNKKKNISIYIQIVTNQGKNPSIDIAAERFLVCFLHKLIGCIHGDARRGARCIVLLDNKERSMKKITALTAIIAGLISLEAGAHPSMVEGSVAQTYTTRGPATTTNPATGAVTASTSATSTSSASRGYIVDGFRIGHGCSDEAGTYDNYKTSQVKAVSWVWPTGADSSAVAPASTGCDVDGKYCTGSTTQPSVATIPNSSQKPNYKNPSESG